MSAGPVVIVGASVAGVRVAQSLRRHDADREIVLLDAEEGLPYDKPALSKESLTTGGEPPLLLTADSLDELRIDHRGGCAATGLDLDHRLVCTTAGPVGFADVVIATGSRPRRLAALDGHGGVHYLRTRHDAAALSAALTGARHLVIVGGGFIGGEVAAAARALGVEVEIVEAAPRILARLMPVQVSQAVADLHGRHGVTIRCGRTVVAHRGTDELVLDDDTSLPADVVVVGIGTLPATEWLEGSGLLLDDGVVCGPDLQAAGAQGAGVQGVWVVGDVARTRDPSTGASERAEHWTNAREQAAVVARNLARPAGGQARVHHGGGYVWSDQYGVRIQHVGKVGAAVREEQPSRGGRLFVHTDGAAVVGATGLDAPAEILRIRRTLAG